MITINCKILLTSYLFVIYCDTIRMSFKYAPLWFNYVRPSAILCIISLTWTLNLYVYDELHRARHYRAHHHNSTQTNCPCRRYINRIWNITCLATLLTGEGKIMSLIITERTYLHCLHTIQPHTKLLSSSSSIYIKR